MTFHWPQLLWLLLIPAGLLAWELTRRRRASAAAVHPKILRAELGAHDLALRAADTQVSGGRVRPWLLLGLGFAVVALARPQWGRIDEPVFEQSREILIAMDLSRSMLAPDVKPSRLDRAKLLIQSLLEKLKGERVGLVVFSGTAFLQSPLSADYEILREFLPALNPDFLPEGGTNYEALLETSMEAFSGQTAADRFLIILSDGEALDDQWKRRLDDLKKKGVRVLGLGVGTPAGSMIPDGSGGFVKDERGAVVLSKLEGATLQQLAEATNGLYRDASSWVDLAELIDLTVNAGRKGEFTETRTVRLVERFQWPLALALWCFLVSLYYEFPVKPRPREITLARAGAAKAARQSTGVALLALIISHAWTFPPAARAGVSVAPPHQPSAPAQNASPSVTTPPGAPEAPPLARIVGRLSVANERTARDWSDMADETVSWGTRLQSAGQPVPEGPVRDALAAVAAGARLDPKAADWPQLREKLEALLQRPQQQEQPDQSPQQQQKDQQKQDQQQQQKQQKSDKKSDPQKQDQPQQDQGGQQKNEDQSQPPEQQKESQPQQQSAFGDMNKPPPPPPPTETQKVGGATEKNEAREQTDPALALPMDKLEQLRNQDSPAELFQLMQPERKNKPKKDW